MYATVIKLGGKPCVYTFFFYFSSKVLKSLLYVTFQFVIGILKIQIRSIADKARYRNVLKYSPAADIRNRVEQSNSNETQIQPKSDPTPGSCNSGCLAAFHKIQRWCRSFDRAKPINVEDANDENRLTGLENSEKIRNTFL